MRILFLGNNRTALKVLRWLMGEGEEIVGLVLHPEAKRRCGEELLSTAVLPSECHFDGSRLKEPGVLERIRALEPEIALSVLFGCILRPPFLEIFPRGVLNLHPSYLPYNRGQYPNVWSIVEGTPAGVSLHYIDSGIDTGDVVARTAVEVRPTDTGETLYRRLESEMVNIFKETWPSVRRGDAPRKAQGPGAGTYHRTGDVEAIDEIDLDATYRAGDLINLLRARTFPPYPGAYFRTEEGKVFLRLQLLREEDL